jgi:uridine phosphorylase
MCYQFFSFTTKLNTMFYPSSELVLNAQGKVYHLDLAPHELADKIILVGDPDRIGLVSSFFSKIEHKAQHREFVTHTGIYKGERMSVVSTGIGTDNCDIVINELDALANINLTTREDHPNKKSLKFIRIGTCGILQPEIPIHSYIISTHAYGLDNIAHFYDISFTEEENTLREALNQHIQWPENIRPYLIQANPELVKNLSSDSTFQGITVTSSGFYGPQGRKLRLPLAKADINELLTAFRFNEQKVTNFEMESSAIFCLGKALGHQAATICLGVANRPNQEFSKGFDKEMNALIEYSLDAAIR